MFPVKDKNVRRLLGLRNVIYLVLVVVAFAILGVKTLLGRNWRNWEGGIVAGGIGATHELSRGC
jgi:hypothetical protein